MKLPVINTPRHMSPSSFKEWELCNTKFALKRMMGLPYPEYYQSLAAACGSSFDVYIKRDIAVRLGFGDDPRFAQKTMFEKSVDPQNREEAGPIGARLYKEYVDNGCLEALMKEGLATVMLDDKKDLTANGGDDCVPTNGLPDGAFNDGVIIDFKVQGAVSKSGASPNPGYRYSMCNGIRKWAHARCDEPLENLNADWAQQLTIYSWMQGGVEPWRDIKVAIENITVRGYPAAPKVACSSIRTFVSVAFQQKLWGKYAVAWRNIVAGNIADAVPSDRICFDYQVQCEMANHCDAFIAWQKRKADTSNPLNYLK